MNNHVFSRSSPLDRRAFLKKGLGGLSATASLPFILSNPIQATQTDTNLPKNNTHKERILVVVELDGGNDGLNTVIPYGDDAYYRQRPTIGIPAQQVLPIDHHFGFHPSLAGFDRLYKEGRFALIHGCGYENPILSHFAAMGFWHTGVPIAGEKLGWVGRTADYLSPEAKENLIVNIASQQSLAARSRIHTPLVFDDPSRFLRVGRYEQMPLL